MCFFIENDVAGVQDRPLFRNNKEKEQVEQLTKTYCCCPRINLGICSVLAGGSSMITLSSLFLYFG